MGKWIQRYVTTVPGTFDHDLPVDIYEYEWIDDDSDNENKKRRNNHDMGKKRI